MGIKPHEAKIITYFEKSKPVYDLLLGHTKHLGFHPKGSRIPEKKAQLLMRDLVADRLKLAGGMTVLDAGCGEGVVSTYLANKFQCHIVGVTVVPFEAERANKLASKLGLCTLVEYHVMDYSSTGFFGNYFDAIYAIEALVFSPDIRKTFKEFYRILKPDGKITFCEYTMAENEHLSPDDIKTIDMVVEGTGMLGLRSFRFNRIRPLLEETGFRNISYEDLTDNVAPSAYRLMRFFTLPYFIAKLFGLRHKFINLTGVIEFTKLGERNLFGYNIFDAEK